MTTRSIVTSAPVIACDVCGRRLLRGERPDVYLAGAERRTVCELCIPRAAAVGWLREADNRSLAARPPRSKRARSLLGRLRQLRDPADALAHSSAQTAPSSRATDDDFDSELYELLDGARADTALGSEPARAELAELGSMDEHEYELAGREPSVARALEVFNSGEQPRRVAGVSRSLGAPTVTVRSLERSEASHGKVMIVVAWELCWYRYEIDLGDPAMEPKMLERGMELNELPEEDRLANAAADEHGELSLLG